jgi:four helix bundle protein
LGEWVSEGKAIRTYRDLEVWQVGMNLAVASYELTKSFPADERFGLTAQVRRAASSIPANIAEGYGRENTGSFIQFLRIAQGSLKELETHVVLATRLGYVELVSIETVEQKCKSVGIMLNRLIRSLQQKSSDR